MLNVCLAGATGWAGSALAGSIANSSDPALVAAVARKNAGRALGDALGAPRMAARIHASDVDPPCPPR